MSGCLCHASVVSSSTPIYYHVPGLFALGTNLFLLSNPLKLLDFLFLSARKMWSGRPTKDDEAAHTGRTKSGLSSRDPGNLLESPPIQSEEERMTTPAEAILGGLENATPSEVGVLLLN